MFYLLFGGGGADIVVDSLALLLVDGGALLLVLGPAGRGSGLTVASLGRGRGWCRHHHCLGWSWSWRGSVARGGAASSSVGGAVGGAERGPVATRETKTIRTSLIFDWVPPTLLSQAESQ